VRISLSAQRYDPGGKHVRKRIGLSRRSLEECDCIETGRRIIALFLQRSMTWR
jgi:hypothetical protein